MMDMGIHCIDLLHDMTGLKTAEISAMCGNLIYQYPDVEDAGTAMFRMENGAVFTVQANFNIPTNAGGCSICILGTKGSLTAQNTIGQTATGTLYYIDADSNSTQPVILDYDTTNMYAAELDAFSQAILNDTLPPVDAQACITAQEEIEAIYCSQKTGQRIVMR